MLSGCGWLYALCLCPACVLVAVLRCSLYGSRVFCAVSAPADPPGGLFVISCGLCLAVVPLAVSGCVPVWLLFPLSVFGCLALIVSGLSLCLGLSVSVVRFCVWGLIFSGCFARFPGFRCYDV